MWFCARNSNVKVLTVLELLTSPCCTAKFWLKWPKITKIDHFLMIFLCFSWNLTNLTTFWWFYRFWRDTYGFIVEAMFWCSGCLTGLAVFYTVAGVLTGLAVFPTVVVQWLIPGGWSRYPYSSTTWAHPLPRVPPHPPPRPCTPPAVTALCSPTVRLASFSLHWLLGSSF